MINDRFYVHAPEEPLDEAPTRTHKKPKPASRRTGLGRLVKRLVLLLAAFAGLRYLAALPGWQDSSSCCSRSAFWSVPFSNSVSLFGQRSPTSR